MDVQTQSIRGRSGEACTEMTSAPTIAAVLQSLLEARGVVER
jgi:hypothetical protein